MYLELVIHCVCQAVKSNVKALDASQVTKSHTAGQKTN